MRQSASIPVDPLPPTVPSPVAANDPGRPGNAAPFASQPNGSSTVVAAPADEASGPLRSQSFTVQGLTTIVHFRLRQVAGGLHAEREEEHQGGAMFRQVARFRSLQAFKRWCDHDALRFDAPLGHASLLRAGEDLWGGDD